MGVRSDMWVDQSLTFRIIEFLLIVTLMRNLKYFIHTVFMHAFFLIQYTFKGTLLARSQSPVKYCVLQKL